jgi:hypothetical protein
VYDGGFCFFQMKKVLEIRNCDALAAHAICALVVFDKLDAERWDWPGLI